MWRVVAIGIGAVVFFGMQITVAVAGCEAGNLNCLDPVVVGRFGLPPDAPPSVINQRVESIILQSGLDMPADPADKVDLADCLLRRGVAGVQSCAELIKNR